jgi:tetratricopeptide (TPR) repeat protein
MNVFARGLFRRTPFAGLILAGLVAACASEPSRDSTTPGEDVPLTTPTFVGSQACADCHQSEVELWTNSHHDLAMQPATETTVLGDFDNRTLTHFEVTSTLYREGEAFFVRTDGPDGSLENYEVRYTFGAEPLQQYLVELEGGRLQALPLVWDTRTADNGGQRWFHLYPDEGLPADDVLHWSGPNQNWNYMCAECHSTALEKNYDPQTGSYDSRWSEIDVACESCHGPASAHVQWASAERDGGRPLGSAHGLEVRLREDEEAAWVFDDDTGIARRTRPRDSRTQIETCARCHSRRSVIAADYRHGQPLLDTHLPALLEDGLYHADGQILDEVYVYGSFLQSKMYAMGVTCSDCHDPHGLEVRGEGNAVCAGCHLPARFDTAEHHFHEPSTAGAFCVDCHMPSTTYMEVDDRHDHSLRVPRPDLSTQLDTPNACNGCHDDRSSEWASAQIASRQLAGWTPSPHYGTALLAARQGSIDAPLLLASLANNPSMPEIARATALSQMRSYPAPDAQQSIAAALSDRSDLLRTAAVQGSEGLQPAVRVRLLMPHLDDPVRAVRIEAARALASVPKDLLDTAQIRAIDSVLGEYRAAQLVNAERPNAQLNLGALAALQGDAAAAEMHYRQALMLQPQYLPTYVNLADLYRALGRDAEGEALLRQALARAPDNADLHHALGLALVRLGHLEPALDSLRRAAEHNPDAPRYAYVLGVGLDNSGRLTEAIKTLEAASQMHPTDSDILFALASCHAKAGNGERAIEVAEQLLSLNSRDPRARQLLAQLNAASANDP